MSMRFTLILSLLLAVTTSGLADTPKAGHAEQLQFETILREVREYPSLALVALDVFRRIAENSAERITDEMEARFGMQPGQLRGPNFADYFVRDYEERHGTAAATELRSIGNPVMN
jgi:hypothetical protein